MILDCIGKCSTIDWTMGCESVGDKQPRIDWLRGLCGMPYMEARSGSFRLAFKPVTRNDVSSYLSNEAFLRKSYDSRDC